MKKNKNFKIINMFIFLFILTMTNKNTTLAQEENQIIYNYYVELRGFNQEETDYIKSKLFNKWADFQNRSEIVLFDLSENKDVMKNKKFLECFYDIDDMNDKKSAPNTRRLIILYEREEEKFYVMIYRWNVHSWLRITNSGSFHTRNLENEELIDFILRTTVIMTMK